MDDDKFKRETARAIADAEAAIEKSVHPTFYGLLSADGVHIALLLRRNNFQELRSIPDEQLKIVMGLARVGHTCVCAGVMKAGLDKEES